MSDIQLRDETSASSGQSTPPHRSVDEIRAWSQLYAAVRSPCVAEEVVKHLNADPASKRNHLALYIRASTTLREQKLLAMRNQRFGTFVRTTVIGLVFGPFRLIRRAWRAGRDVVIEALPPRQREPAVPRTRALTSDPCFAPAKQRFDAAAGGSQPAEIEDAPSGSTQAA